MFKNCTSLNCVRTNATLWVDEGGFWGTAADWLLGVSATGDFYNMGGASIPSGSSGIPEGWTEHGPRVKTISAVPNNPDYGSVSGAGSYMTNTTATLTATPYAECEFVSWTENGTVVSTNRTYSFTVSRDRNLVANFITAPDYLTLTAIDNDVQLCVVVSGSPDISTFEYSYDGATWTRITGSTNFRVLSAGEYIKFRSQNQISTSYEDYINIRDLSGVGRFTVSGNANTLINYKNVDNVVIGSFAFYDLFFSCYGLTSISSGLLPATTLVSDYCYGFMFFGCEGLTSLPSGLLPAMTLADDCYNGMFGGCSGLTSIPSGLLPATTLASDCYSFMFEGCSGLTSLPSGLLPATTLAGSCYFEMFAGCIGLTSVPSDLLPATTLPDAYLDCGCYEGMFRECKSLMAAPELPATTLTEYCYCRMFKNCSSLKSVVTHAQTWNTSNTDDWLLGVSATGDFYNMGGASIPSGSNGIPVGWTEHGPRVKTISAVPNNPDYGSVSGAGTYMVNTTATLTATPYSGYTFVSWTENDEIVSTDAEYSFTVTGDRSLVANFEGTAVTNHWIPDVHQFENGMDIIAQVRVDGEVQNSTLVEVGAFCGDEVRGSGLITCSQMTGKYVVFLRVYGENNDQITFRIYDHYAEVEPAYHIPAKENLVINGLLGDEINPYIIDCYSHIQQSDDLAEGWNWYSTYIDVEGAEGFGLLTAGLGADADVVKSQVGMSMYYNEYNAWSGSLTTFDNSQMYMIKMNAAHTLEIVGGLTNVAETHLTLHPGWNWVSYPVSVEMPLSDALAEFTPADGDCIKSQVGMAIYYGAYNAWSGSLNRLTPGQGFMYKNNSSSAKVLTYSTESKSIAAANVTADGNHWQPDIHAYADNMNITAVLSVNGEEQTSADMEIGVFCGGECRGSGRVVYNELADRHVIYLTVYGDEGDGLSFRLYDASANVEYPSEADCSLTFAPNLIIGDLFAPYVIDFGSDAVSQDVMTSVSVYPNPVAVGGIIRLGENCDHVRVVNSLGVTVGEYTNTDRINGIDIAGVYCLAITKGNTIVYSKIIVE